MLEKNSVTFAELEIVRLLLEAVMDLLAQDQKEQKQNGEIIAGGRDSNVEDVYSPEHLLEAVETVNSQV